MKTNPWCATAATRRADEDVVRRDHASCPEGDPIEENQLDMGRTNDPASNDVLDGMQRSRSFAKSPIL
jgi:hypothetical protein